MPYTYYSQLARIETALERIARALENPAPTINITVQASNTEMATRLAESVITGASRPQETGAIQ